MKKRTMITLFSLCAVIVIGLLVTVIVLASQTQNLNSNISVSYTATEISGGVSATYKIGDGEEKDMVINGNTAQTFASFSADDPTTTQNLSPTDSQIVLLAKQDLIFTYTFINRGDYPYYATLRYDDTDSDDANITFEYKGAEDTQFAEDNATQITVPKMVGENAGTTTFQVKMSITDSSFDSKLTGTITWGLSKDEPETMPGTLEETDWNKISQISEKISTKGLTADQVFALYGWSIGDEKTFNMTNSTSDEVTVVILDFNHDDKSDGTGKAGITFSMKDLLGDTYRMNSSDDNIGGWDASEMRTSTITTMFNNLPSDLSSVIKTVDKKATAGANSTDIVTSQDKLFLLSLAEIFSVSSIEELIADASQEFSVFLEEGTQYAYYNSLIGDGSMNNSYDALSKKIKDSSGKKVGFPYWLRSSPIGVYNSMFYYISEMCNIGAADASGRVGLSFAFAI